MYFLPDQDLKIEWVRKDESCPREGHSWYESRYCYFEIDRSECDSAIDDCPVYVLYSMTGETLINELARRKASELRVAPATDAVSEIERLTSGEVRHRSDEMEFIGRFIMRSIEDAWDDRTDDQAMSTWTRLASMAPSWRFGFRRRKIQVNRDAIRLTKDADEVLEAREAASRLR
ncbi:hypothetical protein F7D13_00920 [Methylocystis rosea]|uniref:Uncharacterized protein n=1 Tax=Methylocystis rosea TaxID=173366 RepID=A0ABX6ECN7_9HYPH|nr:hypothetical protein [Methylocystis rosea]QGM92702.1 hypothetical protein F7D13_00920 [Methylocystis rosea]